jgi:hypothetical protein
MAATAICAQYDAVQAYACKGRLKIFYTNPKK